MIGKFSGKAITSIVMLVCTVVLIVWMVISFFIPTKKPLPPLKKPETNISQTKDAVPPIFADANKTDINKTTAPIIEQKQDVKPKPATPSKIEINTSSKALTKEDIDKIFQSTKSALTKQTASQPQKGPIPQPSVIIPGMGGIIQPNGMPQPATMPPMETQQIKGISCRAGVCKAFTETGILNVGSTIIINGQPEEIISISEHFVQTKKRTIRY